MNTQHAEQIAAALLRIEAVSFSPADPFTWASGLRSPVYCDNRVTLAYPDVRRLIRDGFVQLIRSAGVLPDVIVGTATAGIPHAAWVAEALDLPMAYVRSKAKAHGRENQIEGRVVAGQRAVVIEDLISTGGSSIAAAEALQAVGVEVRSVLAIFSYGFDRAEDAFASAGIAFDVLTSFSVLIDQARAGEGLPAGAIDSLERWRLDPKAWSESFDADA